MNKILGVLVLTICIISNANAGSYRDELYTPLSTKEGKLEVVGLYNIWIKDYNTFKSEFDREVFEFCANQMISGAGAKQIPQEVKCIYRAATSLAKKHNFRNSEIEDALYFHHQSLFPLAKTSAIGLLNCNSKKCRGRIADEYANKWFQIDKRLFRDLDSIIQKLASKEQARFIANKKKKKKPGLDIADNDVVPASSGSGFFVSKNGHVVSNHHVIEECEIVNVIYKSKEYGAQILAVDKINDLAILKTSIRPMIAYSVSDEDPQLLEDVIVAGFPLGKKISEAIKASSGTVTALAGLGDNYSEFQTDAALNSGNSGGPIINNFGNVVGVAVSKIQTEGVEGFNFGIKSSILKVFANSNGLKFLPPNRREMKKKNLGSLITEGTVYIDCWMTGKQLKKIVAQKSKNSKKAFYSKYKK